MGINHGESIYNDSQVTEEKVKDLIEKNGKGIFLAEYDVTSYSDILAAYNEEKLIITKFSAGGYTVYAPLTFIGSDPFYFEVVNRINGNDKFVLAIGSNNQWVMSHASLVAVDAAIDPTSINPVQNKAIATALTEINDKITGDLNDIFLALASKGVTVPAGAGLDDVAGLIEDIPAGGGVEPLPENWVRVTGLKGAWNHAGTPFQFTNLVDTTNENLESTSLVYIEPITAAPWSNSQQETQIFCPFANLYFQFIERYGSPTLLVYGQNGGDNRNSAFSYGTTFGGMKTLTYKRNVLYMDGSTFEVDPRVYAQTTVKNLSGLWGKWSSSNANTPCTFFDCTVKDGDKVIAHFIPVMNTVTGEPKLYDEISGTLSEDYGATLLNDFEIIP